jgi:predicted secreted Zn-dependent protease
MALVTGALGSVIPKLYELVKGEYNLQTSLRNKITCLSRDLESMHVALGKVADVPSDQLDDGVKLWARDVRELSYDVEDILDRFLVNVDGHEARDPNWFKCAAKNIHKLFSKSKARHQIDGMIKTINEQAAVVAERHRTYRPEDIVSKPAATSTVDPRLAAMYKEATQLVGIEKPSDQLISMLSLPQGDQASSNNMKMKIVSVVGTGGLGKTTLAKAVYDKVTVGFHCRAFVPVGRDPDLKKVFRDVLIDLDKEKYMDSKYGKLHERHLINELREYLRGKRYGSATKFYFTHISIMMSTVFSCASLTITGHIALCCSLVILFVCNYILHDYFVLHTCYPQI